MINIEDQLQKDEGFRAFPYRDTEGKLTIGIGRNIQDKGISKAEAIYLLRNDISEFERQLKDRLYWFDQIHEDAQAVLIMMAFNMGIAGLLSFTKSLEHFKNENYKLAADEILNSKWAKQVGQRAINYSEILKKI